MSPSGAITSSMSALSISNKSGTENFYGLISNSTANMRAYAFFNGVASFSVSSGTLSASTWYNILAVYSSATSVVVYVNGAASTAGSTSITFGTANVMSIGSIYFGNSTATDLWNGSVAYPAFWATNLTSADASNLYNAGAGKDPRTIESGSIVSFSRLAAGSPYIDAISGISWTATGAPSVVADPFNVPTEISCSVASSSQSIVITRTNAVSVPPLFIQKAINHITASGGITCPVTTSLTGTGNLLVVYIGTLSAGSGISSVTDNKGNVYTQVFSVTAFNASLFCYNCTNSIPGATVMTVVST